MSIETYKDSSGNSGIDSYSIDGSECTVYFKGSGKSYTYDSEQLAEHLKNGSDANTFINKNLK